MTPAHIHHKRGRKLVIRLAAILTFLSFFTVTALENSVYLICTLTDCEWTEISSVLECESYECSPCCASAAACTQPTSEPETGLTCRIFIPIDIALNNSCDCQWQPTRQLAVREEHRNLSPEILIEQSPKIVSAALETKNNFRLNHSRPCGVHQTIPTTVLRI
jgi:hypothetical protein